LDEFIVKTEIMSEYSISLWRAVLVIAVFCPCVIFFLFLSNLAALKDLESEKVGLWYLRLIHLTSVVVIIIIIIQHVGMSDIYRLCQALNYFFFSFRAINRLWICLLWESQYRMVCIAMRKRGSNIVCNVAIFIGQLLVVIPFFPTITINLCRQKVQLLTMGNGKFDCWAVAQDWVYYTTIGLEISVIVFFLALFFLHFFKIRSAVKELEQGLNKRWKNTELGQTAVAVCASLKIFAIRRVAVTLIDAFLFIITICTLYRISEGEERLEDIYTYRIILIGHLVSSNFLLYFMLPDPPLKTFFCCTQFKMAREVSSFQEPLFQKCTKKTDQRQRKETQVPKRTTTNRLEKGYSTFMRATSIRSDQTHALRVIFTIDELKSLSSSFLESSYETSVLDDDDLFDSLLEEDDFLGLGKTDIIEALSRISSR